MGSLMLISFFVVSLVLLCQCRIEGGRTISDKEDVELERQLLILNKPPIKTFQTQGGTYDCIDINKQPAFDHPLLKDHKIQMKPTFQPSSMGKGAKTTLMGIRCPKGTVPVRRTHKKDLIRANNFSEVHSSSFHPHTLGHPGEHVAALRPSRNKTYYGVSATISANNLDVKKDQLSSSQTWVEGGPHDQYVSLQAGLMVSPQVVGDSVTRVFIYWKTSNSKTGCYNFHCPGFVQVSSQVAPTSRVYPLSVYGGKEYGLDVAISQDNATGNWWVTIEGKLHMGYWPKSLLPQLGQGASLVAWGGLVIGPPNGDSPPMGNKHFPEGDYSKAGYIENLQTIDASNKYTIPDENGMLSYVDNRRCYGLQYYGYTKGRGLSFLFGGPGGKCGV